MLDVCGPLASLKAGLGEEAFDLVVCCHVLEHTRDPWRAARNIEGLLQPGGLVFVSAAWSQAFHATPDDLWRFSVRGLMRLFGRLEIVSAFYSGGDVGLDVAYRVVRDGKPELDPRSGAVEQGLFQLVLDHEDNRAVLARQATERLPVSRTYMPTLFVNIVGRLASLALVASEQHGHVAPAVLEALGEAGAAVWWKIEPLNSKRPVLGVGERGLPRSLRCRRKARMSLPPKL